MLGILLGLFCATVSAHPTYVRVGYTSCTGCHVSSQGGGLLTGYGKGIASTQALIASEPDEDEGTQRYVQALQVRVLNYKTETESRTFPMQFDYLAQLKVTENFWLEGILAVAPKPKDEAPEDEKSPYQRIYARQFGASWSLRSQGTSEDRLSAGIGPLPMGVGLVDHTAYVRGENRQFVTDNPISLRYYAGRQKHYGHLFAYLPNPQEEDGNEEKGGGAQWWYRPIAHVALGAQALYGESAAILRRQGGLLFKAGTSRMAYLAELDRTWRELAKDHSEFRQWAWYQQLSFYPWEYVHLYVSLQGLERDRNFLARERREALGMELRLWSRVTVAYEARTRFSGELKEGSQLVQLFFNGW